MTNEKTEMYNAIPIHPYDTVGAFAIDETIPKVNIDTTGRLVTTRQSVCLLDTSKSLSRCKNLGINTKQVALIDRNESNR